MAAATDPAKTILSRDRFAKIVFNPFPITGPIYGLQGCGPIVRRNMRLGRTLPISRGSVAVPATFPIIRLETLGSALPMLTSADLNSRTPFDGLRSTARFDDTMSSALLRWYPVEQPLDRDVSPSSPSGSLAYLKIPPITKTKKITTPAKSNPATIFLLRALPRRAGGLRVCRRESNLEDRNF